MKKKLKADEDQNDAVETANPASETALDED